MAAEPVEEILSDKEEFPKTAITEKRACESESEQQPSKKLCTEQEESIEEDDSTGISSSLKSTEGPMVSKPVSNGSSTSTKSTVANAEEKKGIQNGIEETKASEDKQSEEKDKTSESTSESSSHSDEPSKEKMDETASKLLASGISISLIKKKSGEQTPTVTKSVPQKPAVPNTDEGEKPKQSPLEVGPNISVTMVSRAGENSVTTQPAVQGKAGGLSVKSPSELMVNGAGSGVAPETQTDTISVSKVSKAPSSTPAPAPTPPQTQPPVLTTAQQMMVGAFGMGGPRMAMMGGPRGPGPGSLPPMMAGQLPLSMPGLQPRPNGPMLRPSLPLSSAGSVSEQLKAVAGGLADYMRAGLEELLRELSSQGSPEATIKGLQLEMERMAWRHQQEMAEMKQQVDLMIKEMKNNLEKEQQRSLDQVKKQAEAEKQKAVAETKRKQWCAHCSKEAIFYCCWNTSYCDYPCQQAHWPSHMSSCAQGSNEGGADKAGADKQQTEPEPAGDNAEQAAAAAAVEQQMKDVKFSLPPNSLGMMHGTGPSLASLASMPTMPVFSMPGGAMRAGVPGHVSIRPAMPGQFTISRPYFM